MIKEIVDLLDEYNYSTDMYPDNIMRLKFPDYRPRLKAKWELVANGNMQDISVSVRGWGKLYMGPGSFAIFRNNKFYGFASIIGALITERPNTASGRGFVMSLRRYLESCSKRRE